MYDGRLSRAVQGCARMAGDADRADGPRVGAHADRVGALELRRRGLLILPVRARDAYTALMITVIMILIVIYNGSSGYNDWF